MIDVAAAPDRLTCLFRDAAPGDDAHGGRVRSRNVSRTLFLGHLEVPVPPPRLVADWEREMTEQLQLVPGDVECLPWARTQARWPGLRQCVQAARDWTQALSMGDALTDADVALMACRGARYHHDGALYGGSAFCNLFLSDDRGLDLHFPGTGQRIPLVRGLAVVFDTCQPHAVIDRGSSGFALADFSAERDCSQVFLTWELPLANPQVSSALRVRSEAQGFGEANDGHVLLDGKTARVCEHTGRWLTD